MKIHKTKVHKFFIKVKTSHIVVKNDTPLCTENYPNKTNETYYRKLLKTHKFVKLY